MKGLLVKDFRMAFAQKKLWIVMAILGLIMAFFLQDYSMATLYVMLIVICIAATTIAIDQQGMFRHEKISEITDFPLPIPPVIPMRFIVRSSPL